MDERPADKNEEAENNNEVSRIIKHLVPFCRALEDIGKYNHLTSWVD
jgi:hypothetical protein